jgi:GNAT superfamily N-acetyltransferase
MPISILPLRDRPDLVVAAARLVHSTWPTHPAFSDLDGLIQEYRDRLDPSRAPFTLVALDTLDAQAAGLLGIASVKLHEIAEPRDRVYWLGEVVVRPEKRGKGVGTHLIGAIVEQAQRILLDRLFLYTPDQQALYARYGWREIERATIGGELVSVMVCDLTDAAKLSS